MSSSNAISGFGKSTDNAFNLDVDHLQVNEGEDIYKRSDFYGPVTFHDTVTLDEKVIINADVEAESFTATNATNQFIVRNASQFDLKVSTSTTPVFKFLDANNSLATSTIEANIINATQINNTQTTSATTSNSLVVSSQKNSGTSSGSSAAYLAKNSDNDTTGMYMQSTSGGKRGQIRSSSTAFGLDLQTDGYGSGANKSIKLYTDHTTINSDLSVLSSSIFYDSVTLNGGSPLLFNGSTSGTTALKVPEVAGSYNLILPTSTGTSGQYLTSAGENNTLTWTTLLPNFTTPISSVLTSAYTNTSNILTLLEPFASNSTSQGIVFGVAASTYNQAEIKFNYKNAGNDNNNITFGLNGSGVFRMYPALGIFEGPTFRVQGSTSGYIDLKVPATTTEYTLTLPATAGSNNQYLTTNGSGVTSWTSPTPTPTFTSLILTSTDPALNSTTGALQVAGGISVNRKSYIAPSYSVPGSGLITGVTAGLVIDRPSFTSTNNVQLEFGATVHIKGPPDYQANIAAPGEATAFSLVVEDVTQLDVLITTGAIGCTGALGVTGAGTFLGGLSVTGPTQLYGSLSQSLGNTTLAGPSLEGTFSSTMQLTSASSFTFESTSSVLSSKIKSGYKLNIEGTSEVNIKSTKLTTTISGATEYTTGSTLYKTTSGNFEMESFGAGGFTSRNLLSLASTTSSVNINANNDIKLEAEVGITIKSKSAMSVASDFTLDVFAKDDLTLIAGDNAHQNSNISIGTILGAINLNTQGGSFSTGTTGGDIEFDARNQPLTGGGEITLKGNKLTSEIISDISISTTGPTSKFDLATGGGIMKLYTKGGTLKLDTRNVALTSGGDLEIFCGQFSGKTINALLFESTTSTLTLKTTNQLLKLASNGGPMTFDSTLLADKGKILMTSGDFEVNATGSITLESTGQQFFKTTTANFAPMNFKTSGSNMIFDTDGGMYQLNLTTSPTTGGKFDVNCDTCEIQTNNGFKSTVAAGNYDALVTTGDMDITVSSGKLDLTTTVGALSIIASAGTATMKGNIVSIQATVGSASISGLASVSMSSAGTASMSGAVSVSMSSPGSASVSGAVSASLSSAASATVNGAASATITSAGVASVNAGGALSLTGGATTTMTSAGLMTITAGAGLALNVPVGTATMNVGAGLLSLNAAAGGMTFTTGIGVMQFTSAVSLGVAGGINMNTALGDINISAGILPAIPLPFVGNLNLKAGFGNVNVQSMTGAINILARSGGINIGCTSETDTGNPCAHFAVKCMNGSSGSETGNISLLTFTNGIDTGSGNIELSTFSAYTGNITLQAKGHIKISSQNSDPVYLNTSGVTGSGYDFKFPANMGSSGQVLTTNGTGNVMTWTNKLSGSYYELTTSPYVMTSTSASYTNVTVSTGGSVQITLPDATTLSLGSQYIFNCNGSTPVHLKTFTNSSIVNINPGSVATLLLTNIATSTGVWDWHEQIPTDTKWSTAALTTPSTITTENTTNSSALNTGSLITLGGAAISKNLYVGGIVNISTQNAGALFSVNATNAGTGDPILSSFLAPSITVGIPTSYFGANTSANYNYATQKFFYYGPTDTNNFLETQIAGGTVVLQVKSNTVRIGGQNAGALFSVNATNAGTGDPILSSFLAPSITVGIPTSYFGANTNATYNCASQKFWYFGNNSVTNYLELKTLNAANSFLIKGDLCYATGQFYVKGVSYLNWDQGVPNGSAALSVSPSVNGGQASIDFRTNPQTGGQTWRIGNNINSIGNDIFCFYNDTYNGNVAYFNNTGLFTVKEGIQAKKLALVYTDTTNTAQLTMTNNMTTANGSYTSFLSPTADAGTFTNYMGANTNTNNCVLTKFNYISYSAATNNYEMILSGGTAKLNVNPSTISIGTASTTAFEFTPATGQFSLKGSSPGIVVNNSFNEYTLIRAAPSIPSSNYTFTLPSSAGTAGQVLTSSGGSNALTWTTVGTNFPLFSDPITTLLSSSYTASTNVFTGLEPSASNNTSQGIVFGVAASTYNQAEIKFNYKNAGNDNNNITFGLNGSGVFRMYPALGILEGPTFRVQGSTSGYIDLKVPAVTSDYTFTFPSTGGSNGQVLTTNGSGTTSWAFPSTTSSWDVPLTVSLNSSYTTSTTILSLLQAHPNNNTNQNLILGAFTGGINNCAVLRFNYVAQDNVLNYFGIGTFGNESIFRFYNSLKVLSIPKVEIFGVLDSGDSVLNVFNPFSGATTMFQMLAQNSSSIKSYYGRNTSGLDCAEIEFQYYGSGSNGNTLSLKTYGASNSFLIKGNLCFAQGLFYTKGQTFLNHDQGVPNNSPALTISPTVNGGEGSIAFNTNTNAGGAVWKIGHSIGNYAADSLNFYSSTYGGIMGYMNTGANFRWFGSITAPLFNATEDMTIEAVSTASRKIKIRSGSYQSGGIYLNSGASSGDHPSYGSTNIGNRNLGNCLFVGANQENYSTNANGVLNVSVTNSNNQVCTWYGTSNGTANYAAGSIDLYYNSTTQQWITGYNTASDYRLKYNIEPMTNGLSKIMELKPSYFNFAADATGLAAGFIAHELKEVISDAVFGEKDAVHEDGSPKYQSISQTHIIPFLVQSVQELATQLVEQKNIITNLLARLE